MVNVFELEGRFTFDGTGYSDVNITSIAGEMTTVDGGVPTYHAVSEKVYTEADIFFASSTQLFLREIIDESTRRLMLLTFADLNATTSTAEIENVIEFICPFSIVNGVPSCPFSLSSTPWRFMSTTLLDPELGFAVPTDPRLVAIPEPALPALFGIGLAGLAMTRRRRAGRKP